MKRQSFKYNIPKEYSDNEAKGLCRVCGDKPQGRRKKNCSKECADTYQLLFDWPADTWEDVRQRMLRRAEYKCEQCGKGGKIRKLEVDHKIALCNGGEMWDEDNLWVLCHECHRVKTNEDMRIKRENDRYKKRD